MVNLEGQKFNHWTVLKELGNGKILCQCDCENHTQKILDKYSVKSGKSKSCGCVNSFEKYKDRVFGYWTVIEDIDNKNSKCRCICGKVKIVSRAHLANGTSVSCGCKRPSNLVSKENNTYNYLTIIKELGKGKVICRCVCGSEKEYYKYRVINGTTKSCGCKSSELKSQSGMKINLVGKKINEWTILEELGHGKIKCRCSCGKESINEKYAVMNGLTKSCGHNTNAFNNLVNKKINSWAVIEELGHGYVKCRCECGNIGIVQKPTLLNGKSKSCGCKQYENFVKTALQRYGEVTSNKFSKPREQWQINAVQSRDNIIKLLHERFNYKPYIYEVGDLLGINEASVGRLIKKFDLKDYFTIRPMTSRSERELADFIRSIYKGEVLTNVRNIISPQEIDICLPEKRIGIEFNGNYWHSDIYKDKKYHQTKTLECAKQKIRLIHIFEYEWNKDEEKIKQYIKNLLIDKKAIYARETEVKEITNTESTIFFDKYHIQGNRGAEIHIGLMHDGELISALTFGKPRFNKNYEYELIRYATKEGITVVGGAEKLFKYFIKNYNPSSIVTYSDISKFTGNIYLKLGFKFNNIAEPNYVWISMDEQTVLSRYQTQKHKLIEQGLGTSEMTEAEIMENNDYYRVFDCGNIVLTYSKN